MQHCRMKCVWILLTVVVALVNSARVGDNCTIRRGGVSGTCKLINNCPSVQRNIQNGIAPTNCGFSGGIAIVCCPRERQRSGISESKCNEYVSNSKTCKASLIVGGKGAKPGEFPSMVALGWTSGDDVDYACGGTLVSDSYVLSAAHCLIDRRKGRPDHVYVGGHNIMEDDGEKVPIARFITHPKYNPVLKTNDLTLLQLTQPVTFDTFVFPACLWTNRNLNVNRVTATGWGRTTDGGQPSNSLQKVELNIVSKDECEKSYDEIKGTQICASGENGGDTCQGDSGGPIFAPYPNNNCMKYLVGVTSYGAKCGEPEFPAIYTRVASYIPWIESVVWAN